MNRYEIMDIDIEEELGKTEENNHKEDIIKKIREYVPSDIEVRFTTIKYSVYIQYLEIYIKKYHTIALISEKNSWEEITDKIDKMMSSKYLNDVDKCMICTDNVKKRKVSCAKCESRWCAKCYLDMIKSISITKCPHCILISNLHQQFTNDQMMNQLIKNQQIINQNFISSNYYGSTKQKPTEN